MYILSGNYKEYKINKSTTADVIFALNGVDICHETISPIDGVVTIKIGDIINTSLNYLLPTNTTIKPIDSVTMTIDGVATVFQVINGGVNTSIIDVPTFLTYNFLTWQKQEQRSHVSSPRFLRYVAVDSCVIKAKVYYYVNDIINTKEVDVISATAGQDVMLNLSHAHMSFVPSTIDKSSIAAMDVYVARGTQVLSYIQRYIFHSENDPQRNTYVYLNSLGGWDSIELVGGITRISEVESADFVNNDACSVLNVDALNTYKKSSGYLIGADVRQLDEFLKSVKKYESNDFGIREIIVTDKSTIEDNKGNIVKCDFTYKFAKDSKYYNVERVALPFELNFEFDGCSFSIAPRLSMYRHADIVEELLMPVQGAYQEKWMYISLGDIYAKLPISSYTTKGLAAFNSQHFSIIEGVVSIITDNIGINEAYLAKYLTTNKYLKQGDIGPDLIVNQAKKLQTPRKIWGKMFDGSADVSGDIREAANIYALGSVVMFGTGDGSTPTPSVSTLATLLDVSLATINDKDLLSFDAATQKWKNISASLIEGTKDHRLLTNRDVADQHPIAAITGLDNILNSKISTTDPRLSDSRKASDVYAWAKAAVKPIYGISEITGLPTFINTFNDIFDTSISNRLKIKLPTHVNGVISTDQSVVMFGTGDGSTPTPSVSTLATLLDVSLATINDKDLLSFDAATQKWKNISASLIEGTKDHRLLTNRDVANQHPTAAITGLDNILNSKVSTTDPRLSDSRIASDVYAWAKAAVKPTYTAAEVGALKIVKSNLVNGDNIDWNSVNFDMNAITISQIATPNYNGQSNYPFLEYGQLLTFGSNDSLFSSQFAISDKTILSFRGGYNSSVFNTQWNTVWHNNNFNPATKVDTNGGTATYATELRCPDNGQGNLIIGTSRGLLTGLPNGSYPAIKTSHGGFYFDIGGQYVGGIGKSNTAGQLTFFDASNKGIKLEHNNGTPATLYCGTILSSSSVVMYSTI